MSINKMLIDATHPEETRVVVLRDNRVEEFDYESAARKLLRGSIYLAKITRVEPSLQAAFVDYGGNRHGFLAFAEIHPDYYQIPHADKVALLEQESADQAAYDAELEAAEDEIDAPEPANDDDEQEDASVEASTDDQPPADYDFEANAIDVTGDMPDLNMEPGENVGDDEGDGDVEAGSAPSAALAAAPDESRRADVDNDAPAVADEHVQITAKEPVGPDTADDDSDESFEEEVVESLNDTADDDDGVEALSEDEDDDGDDDDAVSEAPARRKRTTRPRRRARQYKIQEVIKRRQIVLIQVVKEERGNKGAALTTYLSLAGRYTVLMPNTARGGGISRKITNLQDRKRLKSIAQELEVPEGMGLIIRTAGAARTKQEIKRDFEYLLRLWENVRSLTLQSTAPSLVYEEGNLIKRSIRDLYTKEIDEVVVAGEQAHKEAKGFMRMLMPSHAKNVNRHDGSQSLFAKFRIEQQLNAMFSPNVQLKSGGYLVINQTEALVAIDVNSGKSTREFSIEETALNTNLEAAEELSRQLKLRDLAGLIVVDFIDMEEKRNNRAVERRLKDSLKADRARIQVGRISHFGLLEMSRQRLRTGVLEGSTTPCEHCQGSGIVRSIESVSLAVLRGLEDSLVAGKMSSCMASCSSDVALYLLNQKRMFIQELEERYGVVIHIRASEKQQGSNFLIEPMHDVVVDRPRVPARGAVRIDTGYTSDKVAANDDESDDDAAADNKPRRRRRRRGRRGDGESRNSEESSEVELVNADDGGVEGAAENETVSDEDRPRRSRRRGRRGGRRHREQRGGADAVADADGGQPAVSERNDIQDATPDQVDGEADEVTPPAAMTAASAMAQSAANETGPDLRTSDGANRPEAVVETAGELDEGATTETNSPATHAPAAQEDIPAPAMAESDLDDRLEEAALDRSARSQPIASEPVIQRVTVGPNGSHEPDDETATAPAPEKASEKPSRRGWWQRQFGG